MNRFFPTLTGTEIQNEQIVDLLSVLLAIMLFACAIYGLYSAIRLRVTMLLFPSKFLLPGNCRIEDCIDEDGFIDYIIPRLTAWSILILVIAIVYSLNAFVLFYGGWIIDIATIIIPSFAVGWLMFIQRASAKRFWGV